MSFTRWCRQWFPRAEPGATLRATRAAALAGDAGAQFALGLKYSTEQGPAPDLAQAAAWYLKAADQQHALAQFNLALMLAAGHGVPRDDAAALRWTSRAAEGGDGGAQHALGTRFARRGLDSQQMDSVECRIEAYKWFHLAAAQGYLGSALACERATLSLTPGEVADGNQRAAAFVARKPGPPPAAASSAPASA